MGMASMLVVAAAAMASAWNTRHNSFVWDDRAAVVANEDVRGGRALWEVFTHDFWGTPIRAIDSHKSYRPLTILSFRLNHWFAGDSVAQQFHVANMLIHVGCSLLVWRVAQALFLKCHDIKSSSSSDTMRPLEFKRAGATLAGLIFAVHPVHCDAVASIVGRADLLCTLLSLLAFLSYVDAMGLHEQTNWSAFMLAIVYAVAASLCKELGFTVFGLFLAYDAITQLSFHYQHQQQTKAGATLFKRLQRRAFIQRMASIVLFTLALTLTRVWINGEHRQMQWNLLANNVAVQNAKWTRVLSYAHIHAWYLWKLVWPRSLCFDYGFKTIPIITTLWDPHNLFTLTAYIALLLGVCVGVKQLSLSGSPVLLMCIAFGVIPFIPASNLLFPVGTVVAERLLYFPSVGFCLLVGHILQETLSIAYKYGARDFAAASERRAGLTTMSATPAIMESTSINIDAAFRRCYALTTLCVGFLLLCGCYRSQLRNAEWTNETSLFHAALRVSPTNNKVLTNIGKTLLNSDNEQAIRILRVAAALLPHQVEGHTNLGLAYWHQRNMLFAARHLYKSTHFGAGHFQGAGYTGCLLLDLWLDEHQTKEGGFTTEAFHTSPTIQRAREDLDSAIESRSYYPIHYYTRARLSYYAGEYDDTIRFCNLALQVNTAVLKKTIDSELILRAGQVYNLMAISHTASGNKELALETIAAGLQLDAQEIDLHANAAMLYAERKDAKRGNFHLEALVRLATSQRHMRTLNVVAQGMERLGESAAAALCRLKANALAAESERTSVPLATSSAPKAAEDAFEPKLTTK